VLELDRPERRPAVMTINEDVPAAFADERIDEHDDLLSASDGAAKLAKHDVEDLLL
jgi:hypothetical protein